MLQDTRRQMSTSPKAVQSVTFHPSWCETKVHCALCTERMAVCLLDGVWFLRWLNCFWLSLRFLLDCFDTHRIKVLLLDADEHRQDCSSHCFTQKVDSGTLALGLAPGLRLALWLGLAVELNKHCLQTRREIQWEIALLLPCHCHCWFYAIFKAL